MKNLPDNLTVRVYGEPRPVPKKDVGIIYPGGKPRLMPVDRDYRTKVDPVTKKTIKYDKGYMAAWRDNVRQTVEKEMFNKNLSPFPKGHPVAMSMLFFRERAASNKTLWPTQTPDLDNYCYAVNNALKRTPDKKGVPTEYPEGILFYDDNQPIFILEPTGVLWATEEEPPGLLLIVQDFLKIQTYIGKSVARHTNYPVERFFNQNEGGE